MSAPVLVQSDPLDRAQAQQRRAAHPERSVWVAASAGTGKTKVLTDRVLALLLSGTKAERILCLTFTRAAAAEMAVRLRQRLAGWSTAPDDAALAADLAPMLGRAARKDELALARRLFGTVLDTAGGLRIQTLHGFCESLLGRFPIEAGIAPHFEVIEERTARETLVVARDAVLRRARTGEETSLADALDVVTGWVGENEFAELFAELARMRGRIARLLQAKHGLPGVTDAIYRLVGVRPEETESLTTAAACDDAVLELAGLRAVANALLDGSKSDRERGQTLADWLAAPATRAERFKRYSDAFLTKEGAILKVLITKSCAEAAPNAPDVLQREAKRVLAAIERCKSIALARASAALLVLGDALLKEYAARKDAVAAMDYDDLVLKTRDLLAATSDAQWVLYKLDNGLDHILIDEAQDTSADQWAVVRALSAEFFASESSRTLFAVGDPKQSIFSFQGADPAGFERMRAHFAAHAETARAALEDIALDVSFRSVPAVLQAVDAVFARPEIAGGVAPPGKWRDHVASRAGEPGLVELWPCAPPATDSEEPAPWLPPPARRDASGDAKLAKLIATRIHTWRTTGELLESNGRPIRPGDVMVLVARRTRFIENLVRELKARDVPVAGIDRMVLTDQLPVMDLVALGNALLLPEDDLNLATVLKSPLFGLSEEQLFALCHERDGTVWRALERRAGDDPAFAAAHAELAELLARADYVPPYELYAEILGARHGRKKLVQRLGFEANDPIDEFLGQALAYERAHPPSLQGFLTWLMRGDLEVKRDLEQGARDEVRIMTVHGAKGLQAPIVFLPDTMNVPQDRARILWDGDDGPFLWAPRRDVEDATAARLREVVRTQQEQERRRLLYVAMTRACDRLYVCGWNSKTAPPSGCWHRLITAGLQDAAKPVHFDFTAEIGDDGWPGDGLRLEHRGPVREKQMEEPPQHVLPLPAFADTPAPAEPRAARPLTPSRMDADAPAARSPVGDDGARARGRIIHTLLEHLPTLAPERRSEAAQRLIAKHAPDFGAEAAGSMARAICDLIAAPTFAPLFGENSLAEVPIVGRIGDAVIAGQVDRLVVTPERVLIVDYKSGEPPKRNAETPRAYVRQLAAYRAVLANIYPGRPISCAILWTITPALIEIAPADLDFLAP